MNYTRPEILGRLAGAYVLGTMGGGARRRFARLHAESLVVQRAVADWHNKLEPLQRSIAPVAPPPAVWTRIAARLQAQAARQGQAASGFAAWRRHLWRWLNPALGFAFGAVLATVFVSHNAHMFGMHHMSASLPASYVGVLSDAGGVPVVTVGSHRRGETMTIKVLRPLPIPPGKVARLWALPAQGAPLALANLPPHGKRMITLGAAAEEVFATVPRLAVSYEDDPQATAPTAAFEFSGPCVKFW